MSNNTTEILTGTGVLAVAVAFLVYMAGVGGVGVSNAGNATYTASFRSAEGIGIGTDVRLAGVKVGSVLDMRLDPQTFRAETVFGCGPFNCFTFGDQWADPIGLTTLTHRRLQMLNNLANPASRNHHRVDRLATGWLFIQNRDIHIAILRQRQRARDRGRRHNQNIGHLTFRAQFHALRYAKPMLFVDDRKAQVVKDHITLKHRMGAQKNMNAPLG